MDIDKLPYTKALQNFMKPPKEQFHITDEYVACPPALWIRDDRNNQWTLDLKPHHRAPHGEFAFEVLVNGKRTGIVASRIERYHGKIRFFTDEGWKYWTGHEFV